MFVITVISRLEKQLILHFQCFLHSCGYKGKLAATSVTLLFADVDPADLVGYTGVCPLAFHVCPSQNCLLNGSQRPSQTKGIY